MSSVGLGSKLAVNHIRTGRLIYLTDHLRPLTIASPRRVFEERTAAGVFGSISHFAYVCVPVLVGRNTTTSFAGIGRRASSGSEFAYSYKPKRALCTVCTGPLSGQGTRPTIAVPGVQHSMEFVAFQHHAAPLERSGSGGATGSGSV